MRTPLIGGADQAEQGCSRGTFLWLETSSRQHKQQKEPDKATPLPVLVSMVTKASLLLFSQECACHTPPGSVHLRCNHTTSPSPASSQLLEGASVQQPVQICRCDTAASNLVVLVEGG